MKSAVFHLSPREDASQEGRDLRNLSHLSHLSHPTAQWRHPKWPRPFGSPMHTGSVKVNVDPCAPHWHGDLKPQVPSHPIDASPPRPARGGPERRC